MTTTHAKKSCLLIVAITTFLSPVFSKNDPVIWKLDNLETAADNPITLLGEPKLIDTPHGKAVEFDGIDDALFLNVHPLEGLSTFTVEIIFNPYSDGAAEQRFFHMQEKETDSRVMFETRLLDGGLWFLDTFIKSGEQKVVNYAQANTHPVNNWYHAAIVVDEDSFKHFVNGQLELNTPLRFSAPGPGLTSLGVRQNKVNWFKGAIRTIRFTPRALAPEDFLSADD